MHLKLKYGTAIELSESDGKYMKDLISGFLRASDEADESSVKLEIELTGLSILGALDMMMKDPRNASTLAHDKEDGKTYPLHLTVARSTIRTGPSGLYPVREMRSRFWRANDQSAALRYSEHTGVTIEATFKVKE